jgi:16S rRNA (guanine(1405)-N(7))-methyltransferase
MSKKVEELVQTVLGSPKYHSIDPALVARIGETELSKGRKLKEAVKATKKKLHQVGGAYLTDTPRYSKWLVSLTKAEHDPKALKLICREVMDSHVSTRERLPILTKFYKKLFKKLPEITSILDVACGLNPLAIPWMPLQPGTQYYAVDMYSDMIAFVQAFMDMLPIEGWAKVSDVSAAPPIQPVDLALVLKSIPCLEQIDKHAGERLLDSLQAKYMVVSFPAKSIGGREKGMRENYEEHFTQLSKGRGWRIQRFEFETELAFLVET